jgi:hypothetical protein
MDETITQEEMAELVKKSGQRMTAKGGRIHINGEMGNEEPEVKGNEFTSGFKRGFKRAKLREFVKGLGDDEPYPDEVANAILAKVFSKDRYEDLVSESYKSGKKIRKAWDKGLEAKPKQLLSLVRGSLAKGHYASFHVNGESYASIPLIKTGKGVPKIADVSYDEIEIGKGATGAGKLPIFIGSTAEGKPAIVMVPMGKSPITEEPEGSPVIVKTSESMFSPIAEIPAINPALLVPIIVNTIPERRNSNKKRKAIHYRMVASKVK